MKEGIRIGKSPLLSIIYLCSLLTCIVLPWAIMAPLIEYDNIMLKAFMILLTGIGGIGIWLSMIPSMQKVEEDWIMKAKQEKELGDKR